MCVRELYVRSTLTLIPATSEAQLQSAVTSSILVQSSQDLMFCKAGTAENPVRSLLRLMKVVYGFSRDPEVGLTVKVLMWNLGSSGWPG